MYFLVALRLGITVLSDYTLLFFDARYEIRVVVYLHHDHALAAIPFLIRMLEDVENVAILDMKDNFLKEIPRSIFSFSFFALSHVKYFNRKGITMCAFYASSSISSIRPTRSRPAPRFLLFWTGRGATAGQLPPYTRSMK